MVYTPPRRALGSMPEAKAAFVSASRCQSAHLIPLTARSNSSYATCKQLGHTSWRLGGKSYCDPSAGSCHHSFRRQDLSMRRRGEPGKRRGQGYSRGRRGQRLEANRRRHVCPCAQSRNGVRSVFQPRAQGVWQKSDVEGCRERVLLLDSSLL